MRARSSLLSLLALAACVESERARDYGDPTSLTLPTESAGVVAWIEQPSTPREVESAYAEIVVGAYVRDERARQSPLDVTVSKLEADASGRLSEVGVQRAAPTGGAGPAQRFRVRLALLHGDNRLLARIASRDGAHVRTLGFALSYAGVAPGLTVSIAEPPVGTEVAQACTDALELEQPVTRRRAVCVHGRVSTRSGGPVGVRVNVEGGGTAEARPLPDGTYAVPVELPSNRQVAVRVDADQTGQQTSASYTLAQDETPPAIVLTSSARETTESELNLSGTVSDDNGIQRVTIESERGGRSELGPVAAFDRPVRLAVGDNPLTIVAVDGAGNEAREQLTLSRVRVLRLGAERRNAGALDIQVDKQALTELLGPEDQKQIDLVSIEFEPAVRQALARIRDPERFAVDTSGWGAPERNMQRILRMTPDVADLSGTSVAELLRISSAVSLPSPRLLGDLLDLRPTDYIVDLDVAARVIADGLVGSHPNVQRDANGKPLLSVSMFDILDDLRPIGARFGPSGEHPGFLAPETQGRVLEPGFLLTFPVTSNLAQYDAIDLTRRSKDYLFLLEGDRVLDFNVLTDDFAVVGLVDEPSIDLRFLLKESATAPRAGSTREAAPDAADPGFFRGDGQAFALPPYLFEHIAAELGYRQLHRAFEPENFMRVNRYDAGSISDAAVIEWNRGWVTIRTAGGLGAPPPPLYVWDLLMEVAEARLHDEGVAQGAGDMAFTLKGLPIGLTADELVERLRPKLSEQEAKLSELLVGSSGLATSRADVFYVPAEGGEGALLFRGPGDGGQQVVYPKPGFYADSALTQKVSVTSAAFGVADAVHEKVAAKLGATYYAADEEGAVFELKISERDMAGIGVEVRRVGGAP